MAEELRWTPGKTAPSYAQMCVKAGLPMTQSMFGAFQRTMNRLFDLSHEFIPVGVVETLPTPGQPETGGRPDFCFLVHDEDMEKLGTPLRLELGIRWWEDVLLNGGDQIYPEDFLAAYPPSWPEERMKKPPTTDELIELTRDYLNPEEYARFREILASTPDPEAKRQFLNVTFRSIVERDTTP